jgi:hypothetical protein
VRDVTRNLIHDILEVHPLDPDIKDIVKTGETVLRESSRPPSACPSVVVNMPENLPQEDPKNSPKKEPRPEVPGIYPSLKGLNDNPFDDTLSPEDQETLDD